MKSKSILFGLFAAGAVSLSACATLDENECASVNWTDLGLRNGQSGEPSSFVSEHVKACAKHGLPVDETSWRSGWESGIRVYCTPENGLNVGSSGGYYKNSCPADQALGFRQAYDAGRAVHSARSERDRLTSEIASKNRSLLSEKDLAKKSAIQSEIILLQSQLFSAERRLSAAQLELQRYRAGLLTRLAQ